MCVLDSAYFIDIITASIPTLHRVGIDHLEMSVEDHSSTALFGEVFIFVLGIHMVLAERTPSIVELGTVQSQQSREQLSLHLLFSCVHGIAVDEVALPLRVRMEVHIEAKSLLLLIVLTQFSHGVYCWLLEDVRVIIKPVQVLPKDIHPVVAIGHPIRIEHGHEFEDEIFSEEVCSCIVRQQKFE